MPSAEIMPGRCGAKVKNGYCTQYPIAGTKRCRQHPGMPLADAKAKGNVVVELRRWGLDRHEELRNPGETLLKLVTQSAERVAILSHALGEAYEAGQRLQAAHEALELITTPEAISGLNDDGEPLPEKAAVQAARLDLERIFTTGGIAAIVGFTYSSSKDGGLYATGEKIRGLAEAEAQERDRCARFCALAINAKVSEAQVEAARSLGHQFIDDVRLSWDEAGLSPEQRSLQQSALVRRLQNRMAPALEGQVVA